MIWYTEQSNLTKPIEGKSGLRPFCVPTSVGFFIGNDIMKMFICTKCKVEKNEEEFHPLRIRRGKEIIKGRKRQWRCKQCLSEYARKHNQLPEVKKRARRNQAKPENRRKKNLREKKRRKENPDHFRTAHLKRTFGITMEDYDVMLKKQNNCCAICNINIENVKQNVFDIDHNHKTKQVRGLSLEF